MSRLQWVRRIGLAVGLAAALAGLAGSISGHTPDTSNMVLAATVGGALIGFFGPAWADRKQ